MLRMVLTGLAASVSPVAVLALVSVLTKGNARRNALLFLLGFTVTLLCLGFAGIFLFRLGGGEGKGRVNGYIDLSLGVLCLLAMLRELHREEDKAGHEEQGGENGEGRREKSEKERLGKRLKRFSGKRKRDQGVECQEELDGVGRGRPGAQRELRAAKALSLGCLSMLVNFSTLVIFVSGLHAIGAAKMGVLAGLLALLVMTAFTLSTLLAPIAVLFSFPSQSELLLRALRDWLAKHRRAVGSLVLAAFGVYLLAKGISTVLAH